MYMCVYGDAWLFRRQIDEISYQIKANLVYLKKEIYYGCSIE